LFEITAKLWLSETNVAITHSNGRNLIEIQYSCEYRRNDSIFRSHPNYMDKGPWHDWVMIKWRTDNARKEQPQMFKEPENMIWYNDFERDEDHDCYSPAKIVGMFMKVPIVKDDNHIQNEYFALVWPCLFKHKKNLFSLPNGHLSTMTKQGTLVPNITLWNVIPL